MQLKSSQGFTLIELILAISIISLSITGSLMVFLNVGRNNANPLVMEQANFLAQSYLEEISTKLYPDTLPCPNPPSARIDYSTICDYQNLNDSVATSPSGQAIPELKNFSVKVNVDTTTAAFDGLTPGSQVLRIDVSVSTKAFPTMVLSAYKFKY